MSGRLRDIEDRIDTVDQLDKVIAAMRGMAAMRARTARGRLAGIRAYAYSIGNAISHALTFLPEPGAEEPAGQGAERQAILALCAEQGFAGTFSERVLNRVREMQHEPGGLESDLLLIGDRGRSVAREQGLEENWFASMIAHVDQAEGLASRVVEELYQRLDSDQVDQVSVVYTAPGGSAVFEVIEKRLLPFDFSRFPVTSRAVAPVLTLPPQVLLARLAAEYIFSEVCEAVVMSFAAENEARMRAMIAAKTNVEDTMGKLQVQARQSRQEQITNEIVELASGAAANARKRRKKARNR